MAFIRSIQLFSRGGKSRIAAALLLVLLLSASALTPPLRAGSPSTYEVLVHPIWADGTPTIDYQYDAYPTAQMAGFGVAGCNSAAQDNIARGDWLPGSHCYMLVTK